MLGRSGRITAFLMLLPSLILIAVFVYGFIFQNFQTSLTNWGEDPTQSALAEDVTKKFIGIQNYENLMTDPLEFEFRTSIINTFFFTLLFVGGAVGLGFITALLLDMKIVFEGFFRTIFLFPMALSMVVTGTIWRWLLQPEGLNSLPKILFGLEPLDFNWMGSNEKILTFNWSDVPTILTYVGVFILAILAFNYFVNRRWGAMGWAIGIGGVLAFMYAVGFWEQTVWPPLDGGEQEVGFQLALVGIIMAASWQWSGYTMAMFLAGIRGVPEELREAARVDGCSEFGVYWRVVLPQLKPVILSAVIILGHLSLKIFDLIFAMAGRQNFQTIVPGIQVYSAFTDNRFAVASAVAVIMLVLVSVVIIPYLWTQLRSED